MKRIFKQLLINLAQGLVGLFFLALALVFLVEWASGCGETYIDHKGVRHANECVFVKR